MNKDDRNFEVLGVSISATNLNDAVEQIDGFIAQKKKAYICVAPVSTVVHCQEDDAYREVVNHADIVTPDGMPLVWLGRRMGHKMVSRTYGPDLMLAVCERGGQKRYRHFFLGATIETLSALTEKLTKRFPDLIVAGQYSPPFGKETQDERKHIITMINGSFADVLWVGLGSPKQDFWISQNRGILNVPVMVGVGAAFDFLSGRKPQAPKWMQRFGLEWFFRFLCEPRRLWRRYLIGNTKFICFLMKDYLHKLIR